MNKIFSNIEQKIELEGVKNKPNHLYFFHQGEIMMDLSIESGILHINQHFLLQESATEIEEYLLQKLQIKNLFLDFCYIIISNKITSNNLKYIFYHP